MPASSGTNLDARFCGQSAVCSRRQRAASADPGEQGEPITHPGHLNGAGLRDQAVLCRTVPCRWPGQCLLACSGHRCPERCPHAAPDGRLRLGTQPTALRLRRPAQPQPLRNSHLWPLVCDSCSGEQHVPSEGCQPCQAPLPGLPPAASHLLKTTPPREKRSTWPNQARCPLGASLSTEIDGLLFYFLSSGKIEGGFKMSTFLTEDKLHSKYHSF